MSRLAPFGFLRKALRQFLFHWPKQGGFSDWARLGLLLAAAIFFSFWLATSSVEADMLFQSAVSPILESPIISAPVEQPAPAVIDPNSPLPPVIDPNAPPVVDPNAPPPVVDPNAAPPLVDPNAPLPPATPTDEPIRREEEEAPLEEIDNEGSGNFILDQAELIDTIVVSGAYIWLCCGVSLFLLVPLVLLFVYIRGRSKIIQEEGY